MNSLESVSGGILTTIGIVTLFITLGYSADDNYKIRDIMLCGGQKRWVLSWLIGYIITGQITSTIGNGGSIDVLQQPLRVSIGFFTTGFAIILAAKSRL